MVLEKRIAFGNIFSSLVDGHFDIALSLIHYQLLLLVIVKTCASSVDKVQTCVMSHKLH